MTAALAAEIARIANGFNASQDQVEHLAGNPPGSRDDQGQGRRAGSHDDVPGCEQPKSTAKADPGPRVIGTSGKRWHTGHAGFRSGQEIGQAFLTPVPPVGSKTPLSGT